MEPTMASWLRILTTVATGRVRREKRKSTTSLLASPYSTRPPLVSTSSFMHELEINRKALNFFLYSKKKGGGCRSEGSKLKVEAAVISRAGE